MHSISQPNIHAHAQANPQMGCPRPVNRNAPQFLTSYHTVEENWQMTDELMAEIERADYAQAMSQQPQPPAPGTVGVAYAGGAQSGPVYVREAPSPYKDSVLDRVRGSGHNSPKDLENGRRPVRTERERDRDAQQTNESVRVRDRPLPASPGSSQIHPQPRNLSPERKSPPYLTAQSSSGEGPPTNDYGSFKREPYQPPHTRIPTPPPTVRKPSGAPVTSDVRTTPPAASKLASQTPPLQAMKTRTPDKSLPVQEEQEDDVALKKSTGHLQYDHGSDPHRDDDDDDTLIENDHEYAHNDNDEDGGSGSYTPRSPSANLPEPHYMHPVNQRVASIAKHHRNGSTDQLGLQSFDAIVNQRVPVRTAVEPREYCGHEPPSRPEQNRVFNEARDNRDQRNVEVSQQVQQNFNHNHRSHTLHTQVHVDDQHYDDPAATYLQTYFQSVRPNAPIPPTPHSQTAAPSPSPLISSIQPSPAPVGSPYPFPFSHVRRNVAYAPPTAPSTTYDPASIEEQIALQMQMYALNNHAVLSDSTFSPSSTPFPRSGYNPWTFLQSTRAFGGTRHRFDSMSMRSSPSHQPVNLPARSSRGRGLKRREKSVNLRKAVTSENASRDKVQPPPRVESTQPRDTSPEPCSSGEETAGEERYDVHEEVAWVSDDTDVDGEWVDEGEDDRELIYLEYHPTYISNFDKRRRRWEARWEALQQAFQALDFETDTTMVLLAAPSHSNKLHSLTSRFVRREQLDKSPAMATVRTAFKGIASRRRAARTRNTSLIQQLANASTTSGDGPDGNSDAREGELKRALGTALVSLDELRTIYEQRVARWEHEMERIVDERDHVDLLLRQTLGVSSQQNGTGHG
ncbi:hypothetical protein F5J12DRAFT_725660 [Pisolithus orientalis]|uniref:uncharacterized protein n=1 Tax=Pisolithus orientalis TaxID=936130 RepID=UPI0022249EEE|nr:uncharacterized protein F5J12DRAFT_725660 [Pisolithus orientalis]KAI5996575.1 hypothetical protein F5J12DRAFT_725660 [Pisolithus orientalis]